MKEIAIVLVDWNGVDVTRKCLASLNHLNPSNLFQVQIILVDNASTSPVKEILQHEFPHVQYYRNESNVGFTGGNNTGIAYALKGNADYILLLNNDTTVEPDFLKHLFVFMEAHPEAGAVQPRIFFEHERSLLWNGGNGFIDLFGHTHVYGYKKKSGAKYEKVKKQPWLTACALMMNVSRFKQRELAFMNEKYFTNYEDVELSFRIRKAGFDLYYVPDSIVYHIAGYSTNTREKGKEGFVHPFMVYMNSRNRLFVIREYSPWYFIPTIFVFHLAYYSLVLMYFMLRNRWQKFNKVLLAIKDGVFGDYHMKG